MLLRTLFVKLAFVLVFWLFVSMAFISSGQAQPRAYVARSSPDVAVLDVHPNSPNFNTVVDIVGGTGHTSPPRPIAITPNGIRAYITDQLSDSVSVIDTDPNSPNFNTVVATVNGVGLQALEVAIGHNGTRAYVTNPDIDDGNKLSVIDIDPYSPNFNTVIATLLEGVQPSGVAITPDGTRAYTVNSIGTASVIDTATNTVLTTVNGLEPNPRSIAFTPDGSRAYVTIQLPGTVKVIDTDPDSPTYNTVVDTIPLGIDAGLQTLIGIAITPDGLRAYAADRDKGLLVIDTDPDSPNFNTLIDTVGGAALGAAGISITFDGSRAYVVGQSGVIPQGAVNVIDTNPDSPNFHTVIDTIAVNSPTGIALFPKNSNNELAQALTDLQQAQQVLAMCEEEVSECRACVQTYKKENGVRCRDDIDNDCDGLTDGDDPDCQ